MDKKIRNIGAAALVVLWAGLTLVAWFAPAKDMSVSERRPLVQFPEVSADTVLSGRFMTDFEKYTLDQFPARDTFRTAKSLFHTYGLGQKDNNGIYIADGYAAKQEYPLNMQSVDHAMARFQFLYEKYLKETGSKVYTAVIPDKGYYLAQDSGHLAMDYDRLFSRVQEKMPWAQHIDLTGSLNKDCYYFTDTHWRQEKLLPAAQLLCQAMGMPAPKAEEFTLTQIQKPFYGVYYGQAALPMEPETLYILENERLENCRVFDFETERSNAVYDMEKLDGKDLYEVYLSGAKSLLRIENPNASTQRELILFRDSFGSAIAPLLLSEYKTVTLVDIRYLSSAQLDRYLDFCGQDVLFLYSSLVLNNANTIK